MAGKQMLPILILGVFCAAVLANTQNETTTTAGYPSELSLNTTTPTTRPPTTEQVNLDEYEVVDVVHKTNTDGKIKAVQTTRTYSVGALDDNFWLKHLGEDFKHAIQLQVGGIDQYSDLNDTKDGVHEEVHHEYLTGPDISTAPLYKFVGAPLNDKTTEGTAATVNDSAPGWQPSKQPQTSYPKNAEYESIFTLDANGINLAQNYVGGDNTNELRFHNKYKQSEDNENPAAATAAKAQESINPTFSLASKYAEGHRKSQMLGARSPPPFIMRQHPYVTKTDVYISAPGQDTLYRVPDDELSKNSDLQMKATFNDYGVRQQRDTVPILYQRPRQ